MILLFSGGIDSYCAWHYLDKPQTLYFDLGTQYSAKELKVVQKLIPSTIIDTSLKLGDRQIGEKAYIPFRNLMLACLAYKYDKDIIIAGVADDDVSDKNKHIFVEFSKLLTSMEGKGVLVRSPFWHLTKEQVVKWYLDENLPIQWLIETISCYSAEDTNYCGKCPSCFRKWCALRANNINLPFFNMELMDEYYQRAKAGFYMGERNANIVTQVEKYRCSRH